MISRFKFPLNAWLTQADYLYVEGRFLWLNKGVDGAFILLWLSIEQMLKLLILQKKIELKKLPYNSQTVYDDLTNEGKKISKGKSAHDLKAITTEFNKYYPKIQLNKFISALEQCNEYFELRYSRKGGGSRISLYLIKSIDELYFLLRNRVSKEIGNGLIEGIAIRKKRHEPHVPDMLKYAYLYNPFFKQRR